MNVFLAFLRRFALGGFIYLILSVFLKGSISVGGLVFFLLLYLIFMFLTWLKTKSTAKKMSEQFGMDIPTNGYKKTLGRGVILDLVSPISVIKDLFNKERDNRIAMFIITYLILIIYLAMLL